MSDVIGSVETNRWIDSRLKKQVDVVPVQKEQYKRFQFPEQIILHNGAT